ncbi:thiol-disulfide isomerase and thioredoxin [Actinobacillus equuli]|nr:thiol-disulfide isomerase and thioredoxin [Actinobacillus equuli]
MKQYAEQHKDKVVLQRSPAYEKGDSFTGQMHATFMVIGREDLSELYLFDSVGRKEHVSLVKSDAAVTQWLASKGLDASAFNKLFYSEEVKQRMEQEKALFNLYNPPYVPIAVLNGKYILLQNTLYNDDYTYGVLDFLIEKLQQERKEDKNNEIKIGIIGAMAQEVEILRNLMVEAKVTEIAGCKFMTVN